MRYYHHAADLLLADFYMAPLPRSAAAYSAGQEKCPSAAAANAHYHMPVVAAMRTGPTPWPAGFSPGYGV